MAHISGTFSDPHAGDLLITFSGVFFQGSRRDAGFPSTSGGTANLLLRAFVGPAGASRKYTEPIDRYAPVCITSVPYPGGSVSWPVGSEEIAHVNPTSGLWSYGFQDLKLILKLIRR